MNSGSHNGTKDTEENSRTFSYYHYHDPLWRRFLMWLGLTIDGIAFDLLKNVPPDRITWQDHLRWFLQDEIGMPIFEIGFSGSGAELGMAVNDEIPWPYLDDRQKAEFIAVRGFPPRLDQAGYADFSSPQLLLPPPEASVSSVPPCETSPVPQP